MKKNPPVVLTIAGSDNSCGAGVQADLKAITALGGYAQTAITCVVAEVPGRVSAIQAVRPAIVVEQIRLSLEAFPVAAIKTGMLYSTAIIRAVAAELSVAKKSPPLVVDPVMVASSGDPLLRASAIQAYREWIFPLATLVTPNLDELRILSGMPCRDIKEIQSAGASLVDRYGCAFLLKGGHLRTKTATDILATPTGFEVFSAPFRPKYRRTWNRMHIFCGDRDRTRLRSVAFEGGRSGENLHHSCHRKCSSLEKNHRARPSYKTLIESASFHLLFSKAGAIYRLL